MNIKGAIDLYKKNITESLDHMKEFTMIGCNRSSNPNEPNRCGCVQGLKWDNLEFKDQRLKVKNGYKFRLSVDLSNELEGMFMVLIQPERIGQTWGQRNWKRIK